MLESLLDLVFAPHCAACDARGARGLCQACAVSLYPVESACPRCALPIDGPSSFVCRRCTRRPPPFARAFSPFRYGGELGRALRRIKYARRPDLARDLAPLFVDAFVRAREHVDMVVPVPLHWRRMSRRGFNQAAELVHWAPTSRAVPVDRLSLRRVRATAAQSGLRGRERWANTASAFAVTRGRMSRIAGKRVMVFDDIMTTGATMAACARALLDAGAASVVAFAVARADCDGV